MIVFGVIFARRFLVGSRQMSQDVLKCPKDLAIKKLASGFRGKSVRATEIGGTGVSGCRGSVERKAPGRYLFAITADHGMPGEPSGQGVRAYTEDIIKLVHDRFDPEGKLVLHYEPENSQLAIDVERLNSLKHTPEEVARFLERQPFLFAAFTEDEVRRAATSLPAR